MAVSTFRDRYLSGACVLTWTEIVGLGESVRSDPATLRDTESVGRETMRRARSNVELLIDALSAVGYVFEPGDGLVTFAPPAADAVERLDEIEARVGSMPLALRWWLEDVGTVNLMGHHPAWNVDALDPLVVEAPPSYILGEIDAWEEDLGTEWERRPFTIDFSPDYLHKANISGGPPCALAVPNGAADGLVLWERHQTTFVNLLRIAFRHGGFLGLDSSVNAAGAEVPGELVELARSLEPI